MALFRKLFYRKPPDGLLEISERVYVFDCCFTTDVWEEENYKGYVGNVISQLREHYPDASILVFNFREGESPSLIANVLSAYDMTIMDYPRQYEGCPLLPMEVIHHFLRSSESWLSLGQQNVLLMHCERGGWPVLAFMLAALLIYRRQYSGEQKILDMVYKQAPRELLHLLSPLNPFPSQLRYLQYVSRRNVASEWPPLDRALTLDCIILRTIPDFDGAGGCRPIFRIYGQDPFLVNNRTPKLLFSTPKKGKIVRHYKQVECELVKIDINCHIQGDVVFECISLHDDMEREQMMFRIMFNTAFIRSNILILNRDEIDTLWDAKDQFPKDFRAEVLFSEMDAAASVVPVNLSCFEEKDGLPVEAFATVQEIFSNVDWLVPKSDAMRNVLQQITASSAEKEKFVSSPKPQTPPHHTGEVGKLMQESAPRKPPDTQVPSVSVGIARSQINLPSEKQSASSPKLSSNLDRNEQKVEMEFLKYTRETVTLPSPRVSQAEHSVSSSPLSELSNDHYSVMEPTYPLVKKIPEIRPQETRDADSHLRPAGHTPLSNSIPSTPPSPPCLPTKDSDICSRQPPPPSITVAPPTPPLQDKVAAKCGPPPPPPPPRLPSDQGFPSKDERSGESGVDSPLPEPSKQLGPISQKNDVVARNPPPPPPLPPSLPIISPSIEDASSKSGRSPPPPPPPPPPQALSPSTPPRKEIRSGQPTPPPPPPPPVPSSPLKPLTPPTLSLEESSASRIGGPPPPPPPPVPSSPLKPLTPPTPPLEESSASRIGVPPPPPPPVLFPKEHSSFGARPPPPPPPPKLSVLAAATTNSSMVSPPPPPPIPSSSVKQARPTSQSNVPSAPPPPVPSMENVSAGTGGLTSGSPLPPPPSIPPPGLKGKSAMSRTLSPKNSQTKKLKPLHWLKLNRAVQGSLWAEAQKSGEAARGPEIDIKELESLFSAAVPNSDQGGSGRKTGSRASMGQKSEKVQLIDHRRAYNCEIMLSKVKIPLPDLLNSVLALEESALDVDQVENLIKFCPTKEEMEVLKGYKGDKEKLGRCEQFFLELMQVPRIEPKLRVFSFKIQFCSQVSDLRKSLNIVTSAADQIRGSAKLKRIMQTILSLGNALNQGTARGSAIGFRLDSLLKLTDTRARNNKMTLMHYLCKVLAEKLPELLDFGKDLSSLEPASKVQLKYLAEEMQAISKGLEKVVHELSMCENDGPVSNNFRKALKEFLCFAEGEVRNLASLYSGVGRNVDALILYFGEDPAKCPFEQVISTLLNFVRMFNKAHEENCKQLEFERKKAEKEAATEKLKTSTPEKDHGKLTDSTIQTVK